MQQPQNKFNLLPYKKSRKWGLFNQDWSYHKTFGVSPLSELPDNYELISTILNQGNTEDCRAFAACAIQESQHGIPFDTAWFANQEGEGAGQLRDTMQAGIDKGFKPLNGGDPSLYKEGGYFLVTPNNGMDLFDSYRVALWQSRNEKKTAATGVLWDSGWTSAPNGIVPDTISTPLGGHAIKGSGWKTLDSVRATIQNSWGPSYGDNGIYRFTREQFNKYFTYGGVYIWRTIEEQKIIKTQSAILNLIQKIVELLNKWISSELK